MKCLRFLVCLPLLLLCSCSVDPEPKSLAGEDFAPGVVTGFLKALEKEDFELAESYLYSNPDYILKDLQSCRALFYAAEPSGISVLKTGKELYGREWLIYVDVKISYGTKMKQLHFSLMPGAQPKLRGMNPLVF